MAEQIPVNEEGMAMFPREPGKWVAYPFRDWADYDDDLLVSSPPEGSDLAKLLDERVKAGKANDVARVREIEGEIEELLYED